MTTNIHAALTPRRLGLLNRLPDLERRQGRGDGLDAKLAERVHHAIGDAGRTADRPRFAATFGAQRIGAAGCGIIERDRDRRNFVGPRQAVILKARGEQLAFGVIGHALIQRLADALRDAAVNLARHQHRIDGDTDIVDRGVAHDARQTSLWIDLDLANMRSVRPGRAIGLAFALDAQPPAFFVSGDFEQADALVGADHAESAVAIFDILDRGFEQV